MRHGGNALAANTVVTGAMGLLFWVAAARLVSSEQLGSDGAILALSTVLATTLATAMGVTLSILLPNASNSRRLVFQAYAGCVGFGLLLGCLMTRISVGGVSSTGSLSAMLVIVLLTSTWGIFSLQDTVLVVCRRAALIPIENLLFGALKLVALLALATAGLGHPILLATVLPLVPLIVAVNAILHRALRTMHVDGSREQVRWWSHRGLIGGEIGTATLGQLQLALVPLVVVAAAGATQGAYYYVASMLGTQITLFSIGATSTFIVEASRTPERMVELARITLRRSTALAGALAGALFLLAPFVMRVYGPDYVAGATTPLRLIAVASLSSPVLLLYMAIGRVRRRPHRAFVLSVTMGALALAATSLLANAYGAVGAGMASLLIASSAFIIGPLLCRDLGYQLPRGRAKRVARQACLGSDEGRGAASGNGAARADDGTNRAGPTSSTSMQEIAS